MNVPYDSLVIPIIKDFETGNADAILGYAVLNPLKLPEDINYVFAISYVVDKTGKANIVALGLISDNEYKKAMVDPERVGFRQWDKNG